MPSQLPLAINFPVYDVCKTGCSPPYSYDSVGELDPMWCIQDCKTCRMYTPYSLKFSGSAL